VKAPLAIYTDPSGNAHDTGHGHPERAARITALERLFAGLDPARYRWLREAPAAPESAIVAAHTSGHLERVRLGCAQGPGYLDPDTPVVPASWTAALAAAGAAIAACNAVATGEAARAFCALRPPGHHAEPSRAMGSSRFNNAPSAALRGFRPDFLIVSAGYDGHAADPLAQHTVTTEGYGRLSAVLGALADELCRGRLVALLEGGYDLAALAESVAASLEAWSA